MRKKFFIDASVAVIGSSLVALIVSILYFVVTLKIDEGSSLILFMGYLTDFFNAVSMFIGFGTIIYAFFKYDFYTGIMSMFIFFCAFIPYFIYLSVSWNIYAESYGVVVEGSDAFSSVLMGIYYSMGSGVINQLLPSLLVAFIACKVVKTNKDLPTKFISWKNKLQRAMIICCISLFALNIIMFLLTGALPWVADVNGVFTPTQFSSFMTYLLGGLAENLFVYLIMAYLGFMLTFKLYEWRAKKY